MLREENNRIKEKVRYLESKEFEFYDNIEHSFSNLVNKYRDSTLKECLLLVDRYRLECKHNSK